MADKQVIEILNLILDALKKHPNNRNYVLRKIDQLITKLENMDEPLSECCETCKYWFEECRRYPPTVIYIFNELTTQHPRTKENDHCGEWVKKQ